MRTLIHTIRVLWQTMKMALLMILNCSAMLTYRQIDEGVATLYKCLTDIDIY